MFEIEEYERMIAKMHHNKQFSKMYDLSKNLYTYEFVSEKIRMTYGQCLLLAGENIKANDVFDKLYDEQYRNYHIIASLLYICFEAYDYESALFYLNELKKYCNKKQLSELVPIEIYLYTKLGINTNSICKTKSAFYLRNQINEYSKDRAINFISYKNHYSDNGFNNDINFESLFYSSLNYVVNNERGIQFNPFLQSIRLFDKYYLDINGIYLGEYQKTQPFTDFDYTKAPTQVVYTSPYQYAEISTLPFTNHICMIKPTTSDKKIKKLTI
ncbi:MAG: hypothetical protein HFH45_05745 [Bacilli bacterium]|nr:hypothetical protein [Bacilli bacterium]